MVTSNCCTVLVSSSDVAAVLLSVYSYRTFLQIISVRCASALILLL